ETVERMTGVLDAPVHVHAATAAGMSLDGGAGIDHCELLPVRRDAEIVLGDHGHHGKHRARRLPALGAAAGVVVRHVALAADGDRATAILTGERSALEFLGARLDALVDRRMKLHGHKSAPN